MTVNRYGNPVFEEGDELFVRLPEIPGYTIRLKAVKAKHDDIFCYGCALFSRCRKYEGNSPFALNCYTTIFEEKESYRTEER